MKGVSDDVGATFKRVVKDCMNDHPDNPMYDVNTLLTFGLEDQLPSINIHRHTEDMIKSVKRDVPNDIQLVPNTKKIHEISATPDGKTSYKFISNHDSDVQFTIVKSKRISKKVSFSEFLQKLL